MAAVPANFNFQIGSIAENVHESLRLYSGIPYVYYCVRRGIFFLRKKNTILTIESSFLFRLTES